MAYSNRSVVAFRFSKALFEQCHGAAAAAAAVPPFSPAPAVSISYKVTFVGIENQNFTF